jgi:hypothetical protein
MHPKTNATPRVCGVDREREREDRRESNKACLFECRHRYLLLVLLE